VLSDAHGRVRRRSDRRGAVADAGPADAVFAAIAYYYPLLVARLLGDPHPSVDLVVGHIVSSEQATGRVWNVRIRLRAAADDEAGVERVRRAVREKLVESQDDRADGQITEFVGVEVRIDRIEPVDGHG
jgi:hypothetical protein